MKGQENGESCLQCILNGITIQELEEVLENVVVRDPMEKEFHSAVNEVAASLQPVFKKKPHLIKVFEQMCEPERQVSFRVAWLDDNNIRRINRGFRIQFSSAIGPYKGGIRFHPSVNSSVLKMLAFEQIFKNSLTGLPLGAGKGGSDFDPKGKSDGEIQRFCQSFMTELSRYIADDVDVPAGDIGVGSKEVAYMFGQYKRITGKFQAAITGKGETFGGSICRPEATGYGCVFMASEAMKDHGFESLENLRCAVSGAGNVATYCAKKLVELGAVVVSLSDSKGTIVEPAGFTKEQLAKVKEIKSGHNGKLSEYMETDIKSNEATFCEGNKPWKLKQIQRIDIAFPCATQNEIDEDDAEALVKAGCHAVIEGANMPTTSGGVKVLASHEVLYIPGKMANAGGVAVSGLEMMQNRSWEYWTDDQVLSKLKTIMKEIYYSAKRCADNYGVSLTEGANISSFLRVAEAIQWQGAV